VFQSALLNTYRNPLECDVVEVDPIGNSEESYRLLWNAVTIVCEVLAIECNLNKKSTPINATNRFRL
jgi:hypothetical protein